MLMALIGSVFLALLVLSPAIFVDYFHWEELTAGLVIGSFGVAGLCGAMLSAPLAALFGVRFMVVVACALLSLGWFLFSRLNLDSSMAQAILPGMVIEFGMLLIFPLLAAQAFTGVADKKRDEAAGLLNLVKTVGFSFGVTFATTLVYRGTQENWNEYVGMLTPTTSGYNFFVQQVGTDNSSPQQLGTLFTEILTEQAGFLANIQTMEVMALVALAAMPLALLIKTPKPTSL